MVAAVLTLMMDSVALSYYRKHGMSKREAENDEGCGHGHGHGHSHGVGAKKLDEGASKLLRYRIIAQV